MRMRWLLIVHRLVRSDAASQADMPGNTIELRGRLNASGRTYSARCNNGQFRSQRTRQYDCVHRLSDGGCSINALEI